MSLKSGRTLLGYIGKANIKSKLLGVLTLAISVFVITASTDAVQALTTNTTTNVTSLPTSIGAIGDSISVGMNVSNSGTDTNKNWSTGSDPAINSIKKQIEAKRGTVLKSKVAAISGSTSSMLSLQTQTIIYNRMQSTTILIGANDACQSDIMYMTPTSTYQKRVSSALTSLQNAGIKVVFASVPNLYNLWLAGKDDPQAVAAWNSQKICQSLLANPTSMEQVDVDRRAAVVKRINEYNTAIQIECNARSTCSFDNNAVFNTTYTLDDISAIDYFHPNLNGQNKLAAAAWPAFAAIYPNLFGVAPDTTAPSGMITSHASGSVVSGTIALKSVVTDNVGIGSVKYYIGTKLIGTATFSGGTWNISFNTTTTPNGTYDFMAVAYDSAGNAANSTSSLTINN